MSQMFRCVYLWFLIVPGLLSGCSLFVVIDMSRMMSEMRCAVDIVQRMFCRVLLADAVFFVSRLDCDVFCICRWLVR